jgi:ferredoxin-NADP reductase
VSERIGDDWLDAVVREVRVDAGGVLILDIAAAEGGALPSFEPGAHIAVRCADDQVRHYSLSGPPAACGYYRLGVKVEAQGRGGSEWIRANATPGRRLRISAPRNNFPLVEGGGYLFITGGIGVTPVLPMLAALRERGIRARLVHLCRGPEELAFADVLRDLATFHDVHLHFDSVAQRWYDVVAELRGADAETHVYCCGPTPLMKIVQSHGEQSGGMARFHFEFFKGEAPEADAGARAFIAVIAASGREIEVGADESLLRALRKSGIALESECEEGSCGTCAVGVLAGIPEHRDFFLTAEERAANNKIMACVSRSITPRLTLDLQEKP